MWSDGQSWEGFDSLRNGLCVAPAAASQLRLLQTRGGDCGLSEGNSFGGSFGYDLKTKLTEIAGRLDV